MSPHEKIPCSVPILTFNSEKHLRECLSSVKDFTDVYLVDGGSTDRTLTIAHDFGVPVYEQERKGAITSFANARIHAQSFARFDWILYLDSDEFLSPALLEEIRNIFKQGIRPDACYAMENYVFVDNRLVRHSFARQWYVRLFRPGSGVFWKPHKVVHEKLFIPKEIAVKKLEKPFYGYYPSYDVCITKDSFYLQLLKGKFLSKKANRLEALQSLGLNMARAVKIVLMGSIMYIKHGFKESLPPRQVWRYIRYHLFVSYYRLLQIFHA